MRLDRLDHARASPPAARRPRGRRSRSPESSADERARALDAQALDGRRPARCRTAPCRAGRRRRRWQRSAQRSDSCIACSRPRPSHGSCTHSSSCIWMSEPSRPWISIERSGVMRCVEPSICDWKVTPFSSILRRAGERHHLEAAGIGEDRMRPVHEVVQAAEPRDALGAGPQHQVIGVAEDDVGAERLAPGPDTSP